MNANTNTTTTTATTKTDTNADRGTRSQITSSEGTDNQAHERDRRRRRKLTKGQSAPSPRGQGPQTVFQNPLTECTGFQRDVLATVIHSDETHGIGLKGELEGYYGEKINHARLYPALAGLEEKELITVSKADGRTNEYAATARGKRALDQCVCYLAGVSLDDS